MRNLWRQMLEWLFGADHKGATETWLPTAEYALLDDPDLPVPVAGADLAFRSDPLSALTVPPTLDDALPAFEEAWDALVASADLTGVGVDIDVEWEDWCLV